MTMATIKGKSTADKLTGSSKSDVLYGYAGRDTINGGAGHDQLYGGSDADTLYGDSGNDLIWGDDGDDTFFGGDGLDALFGGNGNDTLRGEAGSDALTGGAGYDRLIGGAGADLLTGGADDDRFIYTSRFDSTSAARDLILDFGNTKGQADKIDFTELRDGQGNLNTLTFNGGQRLANGIWVEQNKVLGITLTTISADLDGDKNTAEIVLTLNGAKNLTANDFLGLRPLPTPPLTESFGVIGDESYPSGHTFRLGDFTFSDADADEFVSVTLLETKSDIGGFYLNNKPLTGPVTISREILADPLQHLVYKSIHGGDDAFQFTVNDSGVSNNVSLKKTIFLLDMEKGPPRMAINGLEYDVLARAGSRDDMKNPYFAVLDVDNSHTATNGDLGYFAGLKLDLLDTGYAELKNGPYINLIERAYFGNFATFVVASPTGTSYYVDLHSVSTNGSYSSLSIILPDAVERFVYFLIDSEVENMSDTARYRSETVSSKSAFSPPLPSSGEFITAQNDSSDNKFLDIEFFI
jgi:hypothetical protein